MERKNLVINGVPRFVIADPEEMLDIVIREQLSLTGTKHACGKGQCGACSVIVNGKLLRSCITKMRMVPNHAEITTIEGIGTPQHMHPLQKAYIVTGAPQCGFCIPGFIVSGKKLLDENPNPTREEVRDWYQKNRNACRCNGYKPAVDAVMLAAKVLRGEMDESELDFKMPADERIWNTRYPRPSAMAKVTGTCEYGADLGQTLPPDTLRLALVQADIPHANILSIDTSEAEKMPGVERVVIHKDVKGSNRIFGFVSYPWSKQDGYDRPILCDKKVFQFGDAVAIVCADTKEHAKEAAKKVKVEYELLPAYMSAPEALAPDAMEIHPGNPNIYCELQLKKGEEPETLFPKAAHVIESDFYTQRQPHLPIEPDVGFSYIGANGEVVVQSKSISLYANHFMICDGLGLAKDKLRLISNPTGGSFGYKLSPTLEALCAVVTIATGRPAYLEYDYFQQISYTGKRAPSFINMKAAVDGEGKLLAVETDITMDHGAYSEYGDNVIGKSIRYPFYAYNMPNIHNISRVCFTNQAFCTAFRAYGGPQAYFAAESMMDQLAEAAGMDPFEFRYKNLLRPGDVTTIGEQPRIFPMEKLMDMMRPKYEAAKERAKSANAESEFIKHGVGIALGVYNTGKDANDKAKSDIELHPDGSVTIYNTWEDHGQGADIGTLSTAHEALHPLGLKPEQIHLYLNDTGLCPDSGSASASRSQFTVANAIVDSCNQLIAAMKKPDGTFRTYDEMVKEAIPTKYFGNYSTASFCEQLNFDVYQTNGQQVVPSYNYGCFMAEVAVDTRTGKTQVTRMSLNADCGVIANFNTVEGQMYGGLAQGIGLALSEDFDDVKIHKDIRSCGIPYIKDVPDVLDVEFLETPREYGPFGASGCGELPLTSPHPAIINAIYHACGVRIYRLPALPEKVLAGLKELQK